MRKALDGSTRIARRVGGTQAIASVNKWVLFRREVAPLLHEQVIRTVGVVDKSIADAFVQPSMVRASGNVRPGVDACIAVARHAAHHRT